MENKFVDSNRGAMHNLWSNAQPSKNNIKDTHRIARGCLIVKWALWCFGRSAAKLQCNKFFAPKFILTTAGALHRIRHCPCGFVEIH